jgi:hypothetical protein
MFMKIDFLFLTAFLVIASDLLVRATEGGEPTLFPVSAEWGF